MNNNTEKEYKFLADTVFNTEYGMKLLAYLKEEYVDGTCVDSTPELTYYRLGKKELIEGLILFVENDLEDVPTYNEDNL